MAPKDPWHLTGGLHRSRENAIQALMISRTRTLLRAVTALLFAFGAWRFIGRFELLEFRFAAEIAGIVVFTAFWLFSQKYEPALIALSLSAAMLVAYKAARLPNAPDAEPMVGEAALNRLAVTAARLRLIGLKEGTYPTRIPDDVRARLSTGADLEYCLPPCPWQTPGGPAGFWLRAPDQNSRDKEKVLWYINDSFEFFSLN